MYRVRIKTQAKETSHKMTETPLYWWDLPAMNEPKAKISDPATSKQAAESIKLTSKSQALRLLMAHYRNPQGLTDEEAAVIAGVNLRSSFRTRCSTLRNAGLLDDTLFTRISELGKANMVRVITEKGKQACKQAYK